MSRIRVLGASLVALAVGTGGAAAADLATYSPPPPEVVYTATPAYSWTGAYAGGVIGYGWGNGFIEGSNKHTDSDGVVGGVFAGWNWQTAPYLVLGVETDIMASGMSDKTAGVTVDNNWNGTLRARVGVPINRFMPYATGGLAVGGIEVKSGGKSDDQTEVGYTVGGGVEAAITNNVTARLEYRYTDYGEERYNTKPKTRIDFDSSQILFGVGLKF